MDRHDFLREVAGRAPEFKSLLAAEFNYDWELDWPDVESVLVHDLDSASYSENEQYRDELDYLLNALPTEGDADEFFKFVGSGLSPKVDLGKSARAWMVELRDRVDKNCAIKEGDAR
ncbi:hypothetical protein EDF64_101498 [Curtobacterium flaccumfaciens]|uniref:CdiI immunity protein domain-containing protein n=1 Tax=Curtobacterium flaccumfaciens TaxID=2035 RepID=A0A4R6DNT8_9MICO|nr:contact-dependent growth inhibition system immunity protein [Curtobacterium flaccumfaciens]TDN46631.1 hypothetical protein EDF64_101498 [Curtobacterium flaccumfaciens]